MANLWKCSHIFLLSVISNLVSICAYVFFTYISKSRTSASRLSTFSFISWTLWSKNELKTFNLRSYSLRLLLNNLNDGFSSSLEMMSLLRDCSLYIISSLLIKPPRSLFRNFRSSVSSSREDYFMKSFMSTLISFIVLIGAYSFIFLITLSKSSSLAHVS